MQRLAFASFCFLISASIKSTIARWESLPSLLYSSMCLSLSKERLNMRWFIFPSTLSISCAVILFESIVFSGKLPRFIGANSTCGAYHNQRLVSADCHLRLYTAAGSPASTLVWFPPRRIPTPLLVPRTFLVERQVLRRKHPSVEVLRFPLRQCPHLRRGLLYRSLRRRRDCRLRRLSCRNSLLCRRDRQSALHPSRCERGILQFPLEQPQR